MKVEQPGSVRAPAPRRGDKASAARPGEFARYLDGAGGSGTVSGGNPIGTVDALLAAQSVDATGDEARRQACKRGDDILDRLDEIRLALLGGSLSAAQVQSLAGLVRARRAAVADPRLREILDEIELRAEVEIAKLAMRGSAP